MRYPVSRNKSFAERLIHEISSAVKTRVSTRVSLCNILLCMQGLC